MSILTDELKQKLIKLAEEAYEKAYVPFSNFPVGAAVLTGDGKIYTGCNIENVSFGLTNCAERSAIFNAISNDGAIKIQAIAITNKKGIACAPCGACRQVIYEFGPEATVIYKGADGYTDTSIGKLLPGAFDEI